MSRIDELIRAHAPRGVPFKALGEIAVIGSSRVSLDMLDASTYVGVDNLLPDFGGRKDSIYGANSSGAIEFEVGDILIGNIRPYLKKVWLSDRNGGASPDVLTISRLPVWREKLTPSFLYFLLASERFIEYSMKHAKGAKMPRGDKAAILRYQIPVPPLELQREIVRVLDHFTELESALGAELKAELEARRRQYEHYRGSFLGQARNPERQATLAELFDLRAGRFIAATAISPEPDPDHPIPCFGGGGLRGYVAESNNDGDRALIGRQGALCGNVRRASGAFYATEHSVVVTPRAGVDIRWGYHLLTNMNLNQYASKSAQPGLAVGTLNGLTVKVPALESQVQIGSTLDAFDSLVNDISFGLHAELAARRKQYEHYRDEILTFEEAK